MYRTFRSFTEIDWESFKDNVYGQIMKEIEGNSDDYLLNVSEMEYVKFLTENIHTLHYILIFHPKK